ncbi:MAG TPA: lipid A biosynthesis acyltransferase [Bacteroidia bacterium]|nr:lipid A biosynthesis acyltransferase [Bacteroidia bacterium]
MAQWEGKSKGTSAGYRIFVFLIKRFGLGGAYLLLRFVTLYYFFFSPSSTQPILAFYRNILKLSKLKSLSLLYQNYYKLGQTLIDKVAMMSGVETKFTFDFDGEENLRKMITLKKGGLLLSGHLGNWEAAGHLLKRLNTKINIVMYDGEDANIKQYMNEITGEKTFNIIYVKQDLGHIFKINEALSANEIVCMHADRYLPGNKTISTDFFGIPAKFPEGPFLLASRLKVPVAYVYAFKESNTHYHFYSTEIKHFDKQQGDTIQSVLNDYAASLEMMARKYPEQWFNYYNFWQN